MLTALCAALALALAAAVRVVHRQGAGLARAQATAEHLASSDALTGLPNRAFLVAELRDALARDDRADVTLYLLDVDRFKRVNDAMGHDAGDALLRIMAERLRDAMPAGALLTRLGGDEFVVLAHASGDAAALAPAERMLAHLSIPLELDGREVCVTPAIGISRVVRGSEDAGELLRQAEAAMYSAKSSGPGSIALFSAAIGEHVHERMELERMLRRALMRGELENYYQPITDTATGAVVAVEALVRWPRAGDRPRLPGEFIPVAEATELIVPLGAQVLRSALRDIRQWNDAGLGPLRVSVNLSVRQLRRPEFVDQVLGALRESDVDPALLELEITESIALQGHEASLEKLQLLRAHGVRIALDDFGTGYSSLSALLHCAVDAVKVDRAFVQRLGHDDDATALTAAIIAMAHALKLPVIAEGVECERQLAFLRRHACDAWQGFLCSPPMPQARCASFLRAHRRMDAAEREARPPVRTARLEREVRPRALDLA